MTHPTTEPNIRERLAQASGVAEQEFYKLDERIGWDDTTEQVRALHRALVDAILAELENPSEGMYQAAEAAMGYDLNIPALGVCHAAMLKHIRDGGK